MQPKAPDIDPPPGASTSNRRESSGISWDKFSSEVTTKPTSGRFGGVGGRNSGGSAPSTRPSASASSVRVFIMFLIQKFSIVCFCFVFEFIVGSASSQVSGIRIRGPGHGRSPYVQNNRDKFKNQLRDEQQREMDRLNFEYANYVDREDLAHRQNSRDLRFRNDARAGNNNRVNQQWEAFSQATSQSQSRSVVSHSTPNDVQARTIKKHRSELNRTRDHMRSSPSEEQLYGGSMERNAKIPKHRAFSPVRAPEASPAQAKQSSTASVAHRPPRRPNNVPTAFCCFLFIFNFYGPVRA